MASEASSSSLLGRGVGEGRGRDELGYMLIASITYYLVPLVVNLAEGAQSPFLFNAWLRIGVAGDACCSPDNLSPQWASEGPGRRAGREVTRCLASECAHRLGCC